MYFKTNQIIFTFIPYNMPKQKLNTSIAFLLVFGLFIFLSLNRHSKSKPFTYHSELWADKAGYNVYLPSIFIYNFNATQFPKNIVTKTGNGFKLDSTSQKIITKYPYGVSLLQSPFWLVAHFIADTKDGYSSPYQKSIDIAGSFYLALGLFFVFFLFKKQYSRLQSILLSIVTLFSSGIFYYGIFETGMSHIYSFFCLAILLYLIFNKKKHNSITYLYLLAISTTLYIVIRPINTIFLMPLFSYFIYLNNPNYFNFHTLLNLKWKEIAVIILLVLIIISPQLFYYKYAFNEFFAKSYQNESFQFPTIDRITKLLFSPNNGLLIYYPTCLLLIFYSFIQKHNFRYVALILFASYVVIYASWWSLSLGCSFGHRAMNDIYLLFLIPIFFKPLKKWVLISIIILSLANFKFIFSYDTCLYTSINWDYTEYLSILFGEFK
jgi:hypothetical protein